MNQLLNTEGTATAAAIISVLVILLYVASRLGAPRRRPAALPPEVAAACHDVVARAILPEVERPVVPTRGARIRLPVTVH